MSTAINSNATFTHFEYDLSNGYNQLLTYSYIQDEGEGREHIWNWELKAQLTVIYY